MTKEYLMAYLIQTMKNYLNTIKQHDRTKVEYMLSVMKDNPNIITYDRHYYNFGESNKYFRKNVGYNVAINRSKILKQYGSKLVATSLKKLYTINNVFFYINCLHSN
jgi:hypothetical protein